MSADADLRDALPDPPGPRPEARSAALAAAMARYDRHIAVGGENNVQGIPDGARQRQRGAGKPSGAEDRRMRRRTYLKIAACLALVASPFVLLEPADRGLGQVQMSASSSFEMPPAPSPPSRGGNTTIGQAAQEVVSIPRYKLRNFAGIADGIKGMFSDDTQAEMDRLRSRSSMNVPLPSSRLQGAPAQSAMPTVTARAPEPRPYLPPEPTGGDAFQAREQSGYRQVRAEPVSTFSLDVDTGSYAFTRASLRRGVLPPAASVRPEEFLNYFPYAYPAPAKGEDAFRATISVMPSPWNPGRKLVSVGIKAYEVPAAERPRANLVFLIDTSGSMQAPDRLPLAKQALSLLLGELRPGDTVGIVTYAGAAGIALEPTDVSERDRIAAAIDRLSATGSTAGFDGIRQAYALAQRNFDPKGVNRIVLATDGDFNVGISSPAELKAFVAAKRATGVYLSVLGFGMGNYHDTTMQALAQNGNGTAAYVDSLGEARKVLVEEATSSVVPVADDAKAQIEFNPRTVAEYRLVGYEKRALRREDFDNDRVDAGDIGSGHTVTALYEIVPAGAAPTVPPLRYGTDAAKPAEAAPPAEGSDEYGFLKLRYKRPGASDSVLMSKPFGPGEESATFDGAPVEARFGVAAAGFAEILRGSPYVGGLDWDAVISEGLAARGEDPYGYRSEFVQLVRTAKTLSDRRTGGR